MPNNTFNLLMVCRGNVNRSPGLEALFLRESRKYCDLRVSSAGINPLPYLGGMSNEMYTALMAAGYGGEAEKVMRNKFPNKIREEIVNKSDLILCAKPKHIGELEKLFSPEILRGKAYALPAYAGFPKESLPDPSEKARELSYDSRLLIWFTKTFAGLEKAKKKTDFLKTLQLSDSERIKKIYRSNVALMMRYVPRVVERLESEGKIHRT